MHNTKIKTTLSIVKATTNVAAIEPKNTQVAIILVESNIFFNWETNPVRKPVATRPITLPIVYNTAKPGLLPEISKRVEHRDKTIPTEKQIPKA